MTGRFQITEQNSLAISVIRSLACLSIIACHFLQAAESDLANVLNVGVQIFLLLSGFLYGAKGITNIRHFYIGRFIKIYFPYLLWTIIAGILIGTFAHNYFLIHDFVRQLLLVGQMPGQGHLWFIPVLLFCYLILPAFELIKKTKHASLALLIWFTLIGLAFIITRHFYCIWIATYFIGYIIGRYSKLFSYFVALACAVFLLFASTDIFNIGFQSAILHVSAAIIILYVASRALSLIFKSLIIRCLPPPHRNV